MRKNDVQKAFDSCLKDIQFTPAHRRAVLERVKKEKVKKRPLGLTGIAAVGMMAAALLIMVLVKAPYQDHSQVTTSGEGGSTPIYTSVPDGTVSISQALDEARALEIARAALAQRTRGQRATVDAYLYDAEQLQDAFVFTFYEDKDKWLYKVTVDKLTEETEIIRNDAILAQSDEEEPPLAADPKQILEAYENELQQRKGDMLFWSLEEKARRSDLAQAAGQRGSTWDALPRSGDVSEEMAILSARQQLKLSGKAGDLDVDALIPFVSFLEDAKGNAAWYIQFAETNAATRTIGVEVKARGVNTAPALTAEPTPTQAYPVDMDVEAYVTYYYNPSGGVMYHFDPYCPSVSSGYLPLSPVQSDAVLSKLLPCSTCVNVH